MKIDVSGYSDKDYCNSNTITCHELFHDCGQLPKPQINILKRLFFIYRVFCFIILPEMKLEKMSLRSWDFQVSRSTKTRLIELSLVFSECKTWRYQNLISIYFLNVYTRFLVKMALKQTTRILGFLFCSLIAQNNY